MFLLTRPSDQEIHTFVDQQKRSSFSYTAIGSSRQRKTPAGYEEDHNRVRLDSGGKTWTSAKRAIEEWKMFDIPFVRLCWPQPAADGADVAILIRHFGFWSLNASRVIYTIDEPVCFGFAYGTLQDHAESGEERFTVDWNEGEDSVWYDLFAFSRPHAPLAAMAKPLARRLQRMFARESMSAMVRATR